MSQSNSSDYGYGGGLNASGNSSSTPVNGSDGGGTSALESDTVTSSGSTPFLYFLLLVWVVWILLHIIWIPLLVIRNRRVSNWKRSQRIAAGNTGSNANVETQNYNYQRHKESGFQVTMSLLLIFATTVGLGLSIFANLSCDFVQLDESLTVEWKIDSQEEFFRLMNEGGDYIINTGDTLKLEFFSMGLWALGMSSSQSDFLGGGNEYQDSCFNISQTASWDMGWQFQLARAASVTASLLGGLSLLFLFTGCCNASQRGYFHFLTLPFLVATILQSLTLFLLDTSYCTSLVKSNNCEMGLGAAASISASVYWFFCTLASMTPFPPIEATFRPLPTDDKPIQLSDQVSP